MKGYGVELWSGASLYKSNPLPGQTFPSRNWNWNVHINNSLNIIPHIDLRSISRNLSWSRCFKTYPDPERIFSPGFSREGTTFFKVCEEEIIFSLPL